MFKTRPGAPVSRIKLPSVVSAFAFIKIRFPARLNGIMHVAESTVTTGSTKKNFDEESLLTGK